MLGKYRSGLNNFLRQEFTMSLTIRAPNMATAAWLQCYLRSMTASSLCVNEQVICQASYYNEQMICQDRTTMDSSLNTMPRDSIRSSQPQNTAWLHVHCVILQCTIMDRSLNTIPRAASVWYRRSLKPASNHCMTAWSLFHRPGTYCKEHKIIKTCACESLLFFEEKK